MRRLFKSIALISVLLFTFSLLGCESNHDSSKEAKKEVKTTETVNHSEQTKGSKIDSSEDQAATSVGTEADEKNTAQASPQTSTNTKNTQNSQVVSSTSKPSTSPSKSTPPAATKPAVSKAVTSAPATNTTSKPSTTPQAQEPAAAVTFSIVGPKERGTIIKASQVTIKDGITIFDILKQEAQKQNIVVDSRGSGATAYVEGIDNFYEFDYGAKSGWVFKLNGVSLTKSIGTIKVKDGDRIECYYTE